MRYLLGLVVVLAALGGCTSTGSTSGPAPRESNGDDASCMIDPPAGASTRRRAPCQSALATPGHAVDNTGT